MPCQHKLVFASSSVPGFRQQLVRVLTQSEHISHVVLSPFKARSVGVVDSLKRPNSWVESCDSMQRLRSLALAPYRCLSWNAQVVSSQAIFDHPKRRFHFLGQLLRCPHDPFREQRREQAPRSPPVSPSNLKRLLTISFAFELFEFCFQSSFWVALSHLPEFCPVRFLCFVKIPDHRISDFTRNLFQPIFAVGVQSDFAHLFETDPTLPHIWESLDKKVVGVSTSSEPLIKDLLLVVGRENANSSRPENGSFNVFSHRSRFVLWDRLPSFRFLLFCAFDSSPLGVHDDLRQRGL